MSDQSIRKRDAKTDPVKNCVFCHSLLARKRINGRLEDFGVFAKRKYCDQKCMAAGMLQENVSRGAYLWRARKHRKSKCEQCDATKELSINHKNRDWSDNNPSNLETLCISCHMKKHWAEPDRLYPIKERRCVVCNKAGKLVHDLCGKHWQRFKKYGDPLLTKTKQGIRVGDPQPLIRVTD